jgi:hypothetical protein
MSDGGSTSVVPSVEVSSLENSLGCSDASPRHGCFGCCDNSDVRRAGWGLPSSHMWHQLSHRWLGVVFQLLAADYQGQSHVMACGCPGAHKILKTHY